MARSTLTRERLERIDRLYSLRELAELGYGCRRANLDRIRDGQLPAVMVGGAWKVRESDLDLLARPASAVMDESADSDSSPRTTDSDDLDALAARVVAGWPRLSEERKRELGSLLSTP